MEVKELIQRISKFLRMKPIKTVHEEDKKLLIGDKISTTREIFRHLFLLPILPRFVKREFEYFFLYKFFTWCGERKLADEILQRWILDVIEEYGGNIGNVKGF